MSLAGAHRSLSSWRFSGQQRDFLAEFQRRIDFYGQVLDEKNQPIESALIYLSPLDNPLMSDSSDEKFKSSKYLVESDSRGCFYLTGMHGVDVYVEAEKVGYYRTKDSVATFEFAPASSTARLMPSKDKPAIFRLRKRGVGAALTYVEHERGRVPKDDTPVFVSLATGKKVSPDKGDFQIECWVNDEGTMPGEHYEWKCRISVPDGGLVERTDSFEFTAPESGYQNADEFYMPKLPEKRQWSDLGSKEYFVKTGKGQYARMRFEINVDRDAASTFYVLRSYLNPTGSRYLEYNKSQERPPIGSWR